ncbi:MAG: hypothetical protein HC929_01395 [Leptolyngbyaceae cyanobacterium SM2_5_2]|nr:hypothetical protein [Leptolyngbyaceae cyanobacterium SM2_5_2]
MTYDGDALQPGQTYAWYLLNKRNRPLAVGSFQIMPATEQQTIRAELTALTPTLRANNATAEGVAAEKSLFILLSKICGQTPCKWPFR